MFTAPRTQYEICADQLAFEQWQAAQQVESEPEDTWPVISGVDPLEFSALPEIDRRAAIERAKWAERSKRKDREGDALRARMNAQRRARMEANAELVAAAAIAQQKLKVAHLKRLRERQAAFIASADALASGTKVFIGKPCGHCGSTLRYISRRRDGALSGPCVACSKQSSKSKWASGQRWSKAKLASNDRTARIRTAILAILPLPRLTTPEIFTRLPDDCQAIGIKSACKAIGFTMRELGYERHRLGGGRETEWRKRAAAKLARIV